MRLLLDTPIILWALGDDPKLTDPMRDALTEAETLIVSAASLWEISIKRALGTLKAPEDIPQSLLQSGCQPLPVSWAHGTEAGQLPPHHADPFDRLIIAQARAEGVPVFTANKIFQSYDVALTSVT